MVRQYADRYTHVGPRIGSGLMQQLYARPTPREIARILRFLRQNVTPQAERFLGHFTRGALAGIVGQRVREGFGSDFRTPGQSPARLTDGRPPSGAVVGRAPTVIRKRLVEVNADRMLRGRKITTRYKKRPRAVSKFTRRVRRIVKQVQPKIPYQLVKYVQTNVLGQLRNDPNEVRWAVPDIRTIADYNARCNYDQLGKNDADTVTRRETLTEGDGGSVSTFDTWKFKDYQNFHFKNNSNSTQELTFYVVKCMDFATQTPLEELTELRKAAFNDTSVLALNLDFNQYWKVPGISAKTRKWKVVKKYFIELLPGQEQKIKIQYPPVWYNQRYLSEMALPTTRYMKGSYALVSRCMGKVSHDATNDDLLGMTETRSDYIKYVHDRTYKRSTTAINVVRQNGNSGLSAPAPVVVNKDTAEVGAFNDE